MSQEEREGMIETLSVMLFKDKEYYKDMDDRRIIEEYDRFMKMSEG